MLISHKPFAPSPLPIEVIVLGSTGSIGVSTVQVCKKFPELFRITALGAGGNNLELLQQQANDFPDALVYVPEAKKNLDIATKRLRVGKSGLQDIFKECPGRVVIAFSGSAGIEPTLFALEQGRIVALANKESVVAGSHLLLKAQQTGGGVVIPVDSEHAALFQLMQRVIPSEVTKLGLTASGGPFLDATLEQLQNVTIASALAHPRWKMGPKISIDSATMVNKALELIEAVHLFGFAHEQIEIVVHPQSCVHGYVKLKDNSLILHTSGTDMKLPIAMALNYPNPAPHGVIPELDLAEIGQLQFRPLDRERFPAPYVARNCLEQGGNTSAIFHFANECAVELFLAERCRFIDIVPIIEKSIEKFSAQAPDSLEELLNLHEEIKRFIIK